MFGKTEDLGHPGDGTHLEDNKLLKKPGLAEENDLLASSSQCLGSMLLCGGVPPSTSTPGKALWPSK